MTHEFIPGFRTESGYDECDSCGLLVDPEITTWITLYCRFRACTGSGNHGSPCVMVEDEGKASCSYCERPGGTEDDAADEDGVERVVRWVESEGEDGEWDDPDDEDGPLY